MEGSLEECRNPPRTFKTNPRKSFWLNFQSNFTNKFRKKIEKLFERITWEFFFGWKSEGTFIQFLRDLSKFLELFLKKYLEDFPKESMEELSHEFLNEISDEFSRESPDEFYENFINVHMFTEELLRIIIRTFFLEIFGFS